MPKIVTRYDPKPIPDFRFDWEASMDDGPEGLAGYGATEEEAVNDLLDCLSQDRRSDNERSSLHP